MIEELHDRVRNFDLESWQQGRQTAGSGCQILRHRSVAPNAPELHNPYAGVSYAWQLFETVEDFLNRLPPATTEATPERPWIYICNPTIRRKPKHEAQNQSSRGNEDEAPEDEGTQLATLIEGGTERLHLLRLLMEAVRNTEQSSSTMRREISEAKRHAVSNILSLAHACRVKAGKVREFFYFYFFRKIQKASSVEADKKNWQWMLFCQPREVNRVWGVVAKATANNELGIAAKVAPRSGNGERHNRLICVYTSDFSDLRDVTRVLRRLQELGVVDTNGRPIFYKPGWYCSALNGSICCSAPGGLTLILQMPSHILGLPAGTRGNSEHHCTALRICRRIGSSVVVGTLLRHRDPHELPHRHGCNRTFRVFHPAKGLMQITGSLSTMCQWR